MDAMAVKSLFGAGIRQTYHFVLMQALKKVCCNLHHPRNPDLF